MCLSAQFTNRLLTSNKQIPSFCYLDVIAKFAYTVYRTNQFQRAQAFWGFGAIPPKFPIAAPSNGSNFPKNWEFIYLLGVYSNL